MRRHLPLLLIMLASVLLAAAGATERADLKLLDAQFRLLRALKPQAVAREVVVVGIDAKTTASFPEPLTLWHAHLGRLLGALAAAKPAVVGLDIVLPDRSYDAVLPGSDKKLLKGLLDARLAAPLVLGQTVDPAGAPRPFHPLYLRVAGSAGYALFPVDSDGAVRRFDERLGDKGEPVPTLVGEMARKAGQAPRVGYIDYWRGAPFQYLAMQQVLEWADAGDVQALTRAFGGKPVIVGVVFPFEDRQQAAAQLAAWEPDASNVAGVLIHAQALRNLLNDGLIKPVPAAAVAAVCAMLALLWCWSASTVVIAMGVAGILLLLAGASIGLLTQGWVFPAVAPALTAAFALGGRNGYDTLLKLRERRRLRASFGGYVSPSVMNEILAGRIRPDLGGVSRPVCILFSDIRGYTTRSERMTPEQIIRFLNRYFERTVALIHERGGVVVCFMGDGIMAVFGEPQPLENACREAFEAARSMLRYVAEINEALRAEGDSPMEIGIGLHFGEAVIGHVGSSSRHDYTAIGDVTNVASRLESLTKEAGYRIVVSSTVAQQLGDIEGLVPLGPMAIKGHTPVEVHGYERA